MSNKSAFPVIETKHEKTQVSGYSGQLVSNTFSKGGLTKREYASIEILSALVAGYPDQSKVNGVFIAESEYIELAKEAVQLTDRLFLELDNENKPV